MGGEASWLQQHGTTKPCAFKSREPDLLSSLVENLISYRSVPVSGCLSQELKGSKTHDYEKMVRISRLTPTDDPHPTSVGFRAPRQHTATTCQSLQPHRSRSFLARLQGRPLRYSIVGIWCFCQAACVPTAPCITQGNQRFA